MKVRKGQTYVYVPCSWDIIDPKTTLKEGDMCRVVHPHGCPPPNTMNHCHVETQSGEFLGLVSVFSLQKPKGKDKWEGK